MQESIRSGTDLLPRELESLSDGCSLCDERLAVLLERLELSLVHPVEQELEQERVGRDPVGVKRERGAETKIGEIRSASVSGKRRDRRHSAERQLLSSAMLSSRSPLSPSSPPICLPSPLHIAQSSSSRPTRSSFEGLASATHMRNNHDHCLNPGLRFPLGRSSSGGACGVIVTRYRYGSGGPEENRDRDRRGRACNTGGSVSWRQGEERGPGR